VRRDVVEGCSGVTIWVAFVEDERHEFFAGHGFLAVGCE